MLALSAAVLLMVASHVVPSQAGVRQGLVATLGHRGFRIAYSLASLAALVAVMLAYQAAAPEAWPWYPGPPGHVAALAIMPVALFLLVCRLTQPPAPAPAGIYRITTTPGSIAVLLWSLVHLLNVGDLRAIVLFLGMAAIALASLVRNARLASPPGAVGAIPFARILLGRERLGWREIGTWRPLLALALLGALLALHPLVIGPDPLAGVL
jgi:uncharacterized membrane protein